MSDYFTALYSRSLVGANDDDNIQFILVLVLTTAATDMTMLTDYIELISLSIVSPLM